MNRGSYRPARRPAGEASAAGAIGPRGRGGSRSMLSSCHCYLPILHLQARERRSWPDGAGRAQRRAHTQPGCAAAPASGSSWLCDTNCSRGAGSGRWRRERRRPPPAGSSSPAARPHPPAAALLNRPVCGCQLPSTLHGAGAGRCQCYSGLCVQHNRHGEGGCTS